MERKLMVAALVLASCGGEVKPRASSPAQKAPSPATACLAAATATRERLADEPTKITVKHILVKHRDADRAPEEITRGREEACLRALEALEAMKGGADFDEVAGRYSDEDGAASRGGMIGEIRREDVAPAFADAAFRLDIQELSYVVETPFGFHLILRTR